MSQSTFRILDEVSEGQWAHVRTDCKGKRCGSFRISAVPPETSVSCKSRILVAGSHAGVALREAGQYKARILMSNFPQQHNLHEADRMIVSH